MKKYITKSAALLLSVAMSLPAVSQAFNFGGMGIELPGGATFGGSRDDSSVNVSDIWNLMKAGKSVYKGFEDLTPEQEYFLGRAAAANLLVNYQKQNNKELHHYLNSLVHYLSLFSDRPETFSGYRVQVIEDKQARAYSTPGGFIIISTGMLALCDNEDELAAVLAHEIGHVSEKHGLAAIKTSNLVEAGKHLGNIALGDSAGYQQASMLVYSAFESSINDIVDQLVESGFSRSQEESADLHAAKILVRAGYRVESLTDFLNKTADVRKDTGLDLKEMSLSFNKTHPGKEDRIDDVRDAIRNWDIDKVEIDAKRVSRFQANVRY